MATRSERKPAANGLTVANPGQIAETAAMNNNAVAPISILTMQWKSAIEKRVFAQLRCLDDYLAGKHYPLDVVTTFSLGKQP